VVADITAAGGEARFVRLDVTSEEDWQEVVGTTVAAFGLLNILVNNAGISGSFLVITDSVDLARHRSSSHKPVNSPANYRRSASR
jgi:NAD(P)-dependent dehydrogenase (short-subunit alcohol dehydrogenase family)